MPSKKLDRRALNRATLARQQLLARSDDDVVTAVEKLAGMQAQLARPPFIGLWSRLENFARADLIAAVHARKLVRATMMRATLHLVSARDYLTLRRALEPGLTRSMRSILGARIDKIDLVALEKRARKFFDKQPATFAELRAHLGGDDERAVGYAVRILLPLIQVPIEGEDWAWPGAASFAVGDTWLKKKLTTADPPELVRRYLAAFGPATPADFRVWSSMPKADDAFTALKPELITFSDDRGRTLYDLPTAPRPDGDTPAPPRFLPDFDNLILSYDDRSRIVSTEHRAKLVTKNLQVSASFLVDGFVAGTWTVERKAKTARLTLAPLIKLSKVVRKALSDEAEQLLRFIDADAKTYEIA
jgi:hypothetical protein